MTLNPPHDPDDPISQMNMLEAALLAARLSCRHCRAEYRVAPAPGNGWIVESFHRPACPEYEPPSPQRHAPSSARARAPWDDNEGEQP